MSRALQLKEKPAPQRVEDRALWAEERERGTLVTGVARPGSSEAGVGEESAGRAPWDAVAVWAYSGAPGAVGGL